MKFACLISIAILMIIVTFCIFVSTTLLPSYQTGDFFRYSLNYCLGAFIIFIAFGSLAVILSNIAGKVGIIVITTSIAIIFQLIHLLVPMFFRSQSEYLKTN
jgi:heme A synthase